MKQFNITNRMAKAIMLDVYTSRIALVKYCYTMKLNVHSGASYVIARRYYGLD